MSTAVYHRSASDEWHTPAHIIASVREVLGGIDLDPASCAEANETVQATRYLDIETNGLLSTWHGRVFLNPPYSEVGRWVEKLVAEYSACRVTQAILLVPARVDTRWWQAVAHLPVCVLKGRLRFSGAPSSAPFPSAVLYLGPNANDFVRVFRAIGNIYSPLSWMEAT